jgi:formylglycine-generating enzyme required for sulfatase activity
MSQINPTETIKSVAPETDPTRAFFPMTAEQAAEVQHAAAKSLGLPVYAELNCGGWVKLRLALIPAGNFLMGSDADDRCARTDEKPRHLVAITRPFYMGVYPVTQAQYRPLAGTNPNIVQEDTHPVASVSWFEAEEFCGSLSKRTGRQVHLPTEAQWEYACRAGTQTRYTFGNGNAMLGRYAWYEGNSWRTRPVGQKAPNAWRLYDMPGNVHEWCLDWYAESSAQSGNADPVGPDWGSGRVFRGGCWYRDAFYSRSAFRDRDKPVFRAPYLGFRVAVALA